MRAAAAAADQVNADVVAVTGHGPQDLGGQREVVPVFPEERIKLPRLPEPGRVGGGVGDSDSHIWSERVCADADVAHGDWGSL